LSNKKGILFVLSGPSGVGKGTIKDALLAEMNDICVSISATTRQARAGEVDGKDYFFVSETVFDNMIKDEKLLEWANVYTNSYGTPRDFVLSNLEKGLDVLLEIDIQGALQVKKIIPEGVFIFLSPPNIEELARRLCSRGKDSQESIDLRMAACKEEMTYIKYYNYVVVNDYVEEAVKKVRAIICAERCRLKNLSLG